MNLKDLLENFRSGWGAGAAAVVAGPLGVWAGELDPPDPAGLAVTLALPFCLVALLLCWLWGPVLSQKARPVVVTLMLLSGLPVLVLYLLTYFSVVVTQQVPTPDGLRSVRVTAGSVFRSHIDPDDRTEQELLMDYGFDPGLVWNAPSIRSNKLKLNALFVAGFMLFTAGVALMSVPPRPGQPADSRANPRSPSASS